MTSNAAGKGSSRIPGLSRILIALHGVIATCVFIWVCFDKSEFNGLQWGLVGMIDFPLFFRVDFCIEALSRYFPAIHKTAVWNPLVYIYALTAGSLYWWFIGRLLSKLWYWTKSQISRDGRPA